MRNLIFVLSCLLIVLCGCDTSNTNPGGHSPEEIANAKPKPVTPSSKPVNQWRAALCSELRDLP
jgi:hypothetical protein